MFLGGAVASSGNGGFDFSNSVHLWLALLGVLMTGPLCTGFSQSINDYFDRDLDAINDPERPIPSGEVTLQEAQINWIILGLTTFLVSLVFGKLLVTVLVLIALFLSVIYSMPPIKLKKHFWLGAPAVGFGYVSLSWCTGHLVFSDLTWQSLVAALLNGGIATGLILLNDIKSVEGDRLHGLNSLSVMLGVHRMLLVAYAIINLSQIALLVLSLVWAKYWVAGFILISLLVPIYSQMKLYREPTHQNFKLYILSSNGFLVGIQLISAFMVGGYFGPIQ